MAAPIKPSKKTALGKDTWWLVPAVATITAPTAAEVNAATGLNITCFMLGEQEGLSGTTERVTLPRLLCETTTSESIGDTVVTMPDLQIVLDPQAASAHNDKKAYEKIRAGYTGFLIRRQNFTADQAASEAVAGQFVDVASVQIAKAIPNKSANDATGVYTATAAVAVTAAEFNVAVAA